MAVNLLKGDKIEKIGDQLGKYFCIGPTLLNREVYYSILIYYTLKELYSQLGDVPYGNNTRSEKEVIDFCVLPQFARFKEIIDEDIKKDPSFANSAIVKFCYSIIKNNKLLKELEEVSILAKNSSAKTMTNFQVKDLKEKMWLLRKIKEKKNFTDVQRAYGDEWSFYELINDKDFKQTYIDKAVDELESEDFRKSINKYIRLVEQGKKVASKYFGGKGVELQAYYTEDDNAYRILNINNDNENEQVRISDILQQEEDTNELKIYCHKKQRMHAYRKDKKRYYEFEEGVCYGMESTWRVWYEDGSFAVCTMVMNVNSDGITEILEFKVDDENYELSDEGLKFIEENDELYIQGLILYDAVMEYKDKEREERRNSSFNSFPINKTQPNVNLPHMGENETAKLEKSQDSKKGMLTRSASADSGYGDNDKVSSNMSYVDSIEKVAENRKESSLPFPY